MEESPGLNLKLFSTIADLRRSLAGLKQGTTVGFVPTMGSFHEGHLSLMRAAAAGNDVVVTSIFVNPLQFGPDEDFEVYPRDLERDRALAAAAGVTHLFVPAVEAIYPRGGISTRIDVGRIGEICEGHFRPGHFSGVATVCVKLFNIVRPDRTYFGEKDVQQLAVVRRVVHDLDMPVEVLSCPTVREQDGLALSSRNLRLGKAGRAAAAVLFRSLSAAARLAASGERSARRLIDEAAEVLEDEPLFRTQYVEVVSPQTFEPVGEVTDSALMVAAGFAGAVRLIDNIALLPSVD